MLIVDGIFLHRPELRGLWNWSVWLDVPVDVPYAAWPCATAPTPTRQRPRTRATARGSSCTCKEADPRLAASAIIDNTDLAHPAPRLPGLLLMAARRHAARRQARRDDEPRRGRPRPHARSGTRKIGHAGTLDPMATGLLVLGVEAATRLLTFIVGLDKTYEATIRLGASTDTDDADGEDRARTDAAALAPSAGDRAGDRRPHRRDLAGAQHASPRSRSAAGARTTSRAQGERGRAQGARP